MKKLKKINKKYLGIIIAIIVIVIIIILAIIALTNKTKKVTCKRITNSIDGFTINENLVTYLDRDSISKINLSKEIVISSSYANLNAYEGIVSDLFKSAYSYLPDGDLEIVNNDNDVTAKINTTTDGIVINNLTIELNDKNNKDDVRFNAINTLSSDEESLLIGDTYTVKELEKKVENLGFVCR